MTRAFLVLLLAVAQIATAGFTQATGFGISIQDRAEVVRTALTPAGYAFAIWGVIYLTNLLLAVYQALPNQWDTPEWRAAGWWLCIAYACNAVWQIVVPLYGLNLASAGIIFILAYASLNAVRALQIELSGASSLKRAATISPIALLAGWAIAASVVGFPSALVHEGLATQETFLTATSIQIVVFSGLALALLGLYAARGAVATLAAIAWGFIAVNVANSANPNWDQSGAIPIVVSLTVLVVVTIILKFRNHVRESPNHAHDRRRH